MTATSAASKRWAAAKATKQAAKAASSAGALSGFKPSAVALHPGTFTLQGLAKSVALSVKSAAVALYTGTFTLQGLALRTKKLSFANPTLTGFTIGLLVMVVIHSGES